MQRIDARICNLMASWNIDVTHTCKSLDALIRELMAVSNINSMHDWVTLCAAPMIG